MPALLELKNVESDIVKLDIVELDMKDNSVIIKDVHIGKGGEARTVEISYDEVKRQLCLKIYELGGTDVLQKFYFEDGNIFVPDYVQDGKEVISGIAGWPHLF